jgi:hypothetical protein
MRVPGFTAEACLHVTGKYQAVQSTRVNGRFGTVEAALDNVSAFECSGKCPGDGILCKSDTNCVCCTYGCDTTPAGVAICRSSPGLVGRPGKTYTTVGGGVTRRM